MIDDENVKTRVKLTHMTFEDWLEAVCRLAAHKALPTDEQLVASECDSAGEYLRQMKADNPETYQSLILAGARPWGSAPTMRIERCIEHMCNILVVTAQQGKGDSALLIEKEVTAFFKGGGAGGPSSP